MYAHQYLLTSHTDKLAQYGGNEIKETLREDCSREIIPSLSFSLVSFSFFCQNCFLYFVENCVISTPIILQCRSVADLHLGGLGEGRAQDGGRLSIVVKLPAKLPPLSSRRKDPWQPPPFAACLPAVCYIVCFFLFVFLASQSSEQRTCLFFSFPSLCDSVWYDSIVYKKNPFSCSFLFPFLSLSLSLSLSLARSLSHSLKTNMTRIRNVQFRATLRMRREHAALSRVPFSPRSPHRRPFRAHRDDPTREPPFPSR